MGANVNGQSKLDAVILAIQAQWGTGADPNKVDDDDKKKVAAKLVSVNNAGPCGPNEHWDAGYGMCVPN